MRQENKSQGKFTLNELTMETGGKSLDLSLYAARVDIYESILSPGVIAEIIIADSTGIFSSFNNEKIKISFTTFEDSPPIEYTFKIIKTGNSKSPENEKAVVFKLTCVSEEVYLASNIKNLPLVRSKDVLAEEAVISMMDALKTEKDIHAEKTTGLHSVSSANKRPFEFIEFVRKIAVSSKHKASAFVFFENKYGYHFKCLETLVEEGKGKIGDKVYIYHNFANMDVTGSNWRTIIGAKQLQVGNESVAGLVGGNKNVSTQFDVITGEFVRYDLDASASFESVSMNDDSVWITTERMSEYQDDGRQAVVIYDSSSDKHQVAEKDNYLPYYISKFLTVIQHITVYGDSTVTVGDIIKVRFPERTGLTTGNDNPSTELDQNLSGNYMICKCRHILTFAGDSPTYFQAFEIVKDGLGGKMPSVRN